MWFVKGGHAATALNVTLRTKWSPVRKRSAATFRRGSVCSAVFFFVYKHIRTSGVLHSSYSGIRLPEFSIAFESLGVCIATTAAVAATATSADAAPTASSAAAFVTSTAAATAVEVQHMY